MATSKVDSDRKPRVKTGGRKKGTPNKSTAEFKKLAGKYSEKALIKLADIAENGETDAAKVTAIKEIFDRAYGKATQAVDVSGDMTFKGLSVTIKR